MWKYRLQREDVIAGDVGPLTGKVVRLIAQEVVLLAVYKELLKNVSQVAVHMSNYQSPMK